MLGLVEHRFQIFKFLLKKLNNYLINSGVANIPWDRNVLKKINKNMGEITHIDETELFCCEDSTERVGVMEFIYRLQCKCEESELVTVVLARN